MRQVQTCGNLETGLDGVGSKVQRWEGKEQAGKDIETQLALTRGAILERKV